MATSKVSIANAALQKLGQRRIESLTENSPNASRMNQAFNRCRDMELRRYTWGFAIKRAEIAADGDQTTWGGWNRFSLPNDFIRLIRDNESGRRPDWRIEGLFIVTADGSPLQIRYVARIEDPNYYDALFVDAFACRLALETCEQITGSTEKKGAIAEEYKESINEAKRIGAIEKDAQTFPEDDWIVARD